MGLLRLLIVGGMICLPSFVFAQSTTQPADPEQTSSTNQSRQGTGGNVDSSDQSEDAELPKSAPEEEDTSPRFSATLLCVHGNTLISEEDLLRNVPERYTVSDADRGESVKEIYDFRNIIWLIRGPGLHYQISLRNIQGFTKYLLSVYQKRGYAGIYVYVPADKVEEKGTKLVDERLHIEILEGKVSGVEVSRYDFERKAKTSGHLRESLIKAWSPVKEGQTLKKRELDKYLDRLSRNPDRQVTAVISPSKDPNAIELAYDVYEKKNPWHAYIQVDNGGTEDRQWAPRVGVVNTNLLGMDDSFSTMFQGRWEKGIEDEYALFSSYNLPVFTDRLRLSLYGGRSEFDVPGLSTIDFLGNGSFYGGGLNLTVMQAGKWFLDLTGSVSFEHSKITPSLGSKSEVYMDLWGVGVALHRSNDWADTSLVYNRSQSMGGSSFADYQLARLDSNPRFAIHRMAATHKQYLDNAKRHRLTGAWSYTTSSERLIPAKMTSFGGLYSVRGYKESEIVSDGGYLLRGQYEFNLISPPKTTNKTSENKKQTLGLKKLAPLVFADYGRAKTKSPIPGETPVQKLSSAGTGLLIELGNNLSAEIYHGWALRPTSQTNKGDHRFNFSMIGRF